MGRSKCGVLFGILLVGILPLFAEDDGGRWRYDKNLKFQTEDERVHLDFINRMQARFTVDDPSIGETSNSFDLSRYRILLQGQALDEWSFLLQVDLAKGSVPEDETNSNLLLDAYVQWSRNRHAQLGIGQGKVRFGRQFIIDSGLLQFVDRNIVTQRFAHGRDVGIVLIGENEDRTYEYSVGLYNGEGINQGLAKNKGLMAAARLLVMPMGYMDLAETNPDWREDPDARIAVGLAVMTNRVGEADFEEERINTGALEFAFRVKGLTLVSEFFTESRDVLTGPPLDETDTDGWYAQAGYAFPVGERTVFEVAGLFSEILHDVVDRDQTEVGIALGLYLRGHRMKIQADFRDIEFEGIDFGDNVDTKVGRLQLQMIF